MHGLLKNFFQILMKRDSDLLAKNNFNNKVSKLYGGLLRAIKPKVQFSDINIYNVEDGFPCIIASSGLHPAIVKASYQLTQANLLNFYCKTILRV